VTAAAYADLPLFAFHLLEFMDVEYQLDVAEINDRWSRVELLDVWTQAVIKECDERTELITAAPPTGIWRTDDDGNVVWGRWGNDWHSIQDESAGSTGSNATTRGRRSAPEILTSAPSQPRC
jgi:hypothetical protein